MFILNPYTAKPNTIIGGVGSVITTKSALATKLGISESIISDFKIVGSDVHCKINASYLFPSACFQNDTNITFYNDIDGLIEFIEVDTFRSSTIQWANFPNAHTMRGSAFLSCTSLSYILGSNFTLLQNSSLRATNISSFDFSSLVRIEAYAIGESKFINIVAPSLTSMDGNQNLRGLSTLKSFIALNLTTIEGKSSVFRGLGNAELLDMRALKTFGTPSINDSTFTNIKLNCTIRVHEDLATSNSGNADASLQWAKDNRSAIVEFYDDAGNYVSTL